MPTGLYIAAAVALVVIVLGVFALKEIRALAKRAGKGEAQQEMSDEAFKAQTRRQKMARRARARGRRLAERVSRWAGTGSS
jgi:uncharacterized membrane protein YhiD involved in acid resistance